MKWFIQKRKRHNTLKIRSPATLRVLPYIYLSAGVSAELFQETLKFAHEAGAGLDGVLCGRATWSGAVQVYIEQGEDAAREWLRTTGFKNIDDLNKVLKDTATSWKQENKYKRGLML